MQFRVKNEKKNSEIERKGSDQLEKVLSHRGKKNVRNILQNYHKYTFCIFFVCTTMQFRVKNEEKKKLGN